ncbi:MAG: polysaccharide deacetylase family protein [Silvanigrellales bacterium]|nr:polysaccharide deacetylase family protein [Silvanigrellales bacterium]
MASTSRVLVVSSVVMGCLVGALVSCKTRTFGDKGGTGSDATEFQTRNLTGSSLGLKSKEIVLTLDDGPGPRTLEVAKFLAKENVPTTFFMVGRNAKGLEGVVKEISEMTLPDGRPAHIIANHSWTHEHDLGSSKTDFNTVRDEVGDADDVLKPYIVGTSFFRPPFGSLAHAKDSRVAGLNGSGDLAKYIGPVFWDIGGDMGNGFAADWACWSQKFSVKQCHDGYVAETKARGQGVILMHDVHSKTVDMIMGTNGATSIISTLKAEGFKFVSLDAHPASVKAWGTYKDRQLLPSLGSVDVTAVDASTMTFKVSVPGATRLEVWVDKLPTALKEADSNSLEFTQKFSTLGARVLTLKGFQGSTLISLDSLPFTVGTSTGKKPVDVDDNDKAAAASSANAEICKSVSEDVNVRRANLTKFSTAKAGEPVVRSKKTQSDSDGIVFEEVFFLLPPTGTGWVAKNFICDL